MSIDLEQLRETAFKSHEPDARTVISLAWLRQVHSELTSARVAQAHLARAQCMDEVVQGLRNVPCEKAVRL